MIGARAYKRHVNEMCNVYIKVSAEDILKRYEEIQKENNETSYDIFDEDVVDTPKLEDAISNPETEISEKNSKNVEESDECMPISMEMTEIVARKTAHVSKHERKIKRIKPIIATAACIIAATSLSIGAFGQKEMVAGIFQYVFGDGTTAKLIRDGYLYEINETAEQYGITANLIGVSGDDLHPLLMCDLYCDDNYFIISGDEIEVDAYILEKEEYMQNRNQYGTCKGKGILDENTPGLYHVVFDAPRTWLLNEQNVIFHINSITFTDNSEEVTLPRDIEFEFVVPMKTFYRTDTEYINNVHVDYRDTEYILSKMDYSIYDTMLMFTYDKTYDPNIEKDTRQKYEEKLEKNARKMVEKSYMVVDGQKYECVSVAYGVNDEKPNLGIIYGIYDALEVNPSTEITLNIDDFDYLIKEKKKMLSNAEYEDKRQEICEQLAETGSTYECNESVEDENYKVTLVRVFGENENPYLQFDVELKNPDEAALNEKIGLKLRMVDALIYERRDDHDDIVFTGTKDKDNPSLYHIYGPGHMYQIGNGRKCVIDIFSIITDMDSNVLTYNDVDMSSIYVHTPQMKLRNAAEIYNTVEDIRINENDYTFTLTKESKLYTECEVTFDIPNELPNESMTRDMNCQSIAWNFVNNVSLIADGNEYLIYPRENGYLINHGFDGDTYTVVLQYEPLNYYMCQNIYLDVKGEKYILKQE